MDQMVTHRVDLEAVRAKYNAERDKRIRRDHNEQYVAIDGEHAHFEEDPYVAKRTERAPLNDTKHVIVIGGGFGGLLAGVRLNEAGFDDVRIIEKASDFGGTWYWNRYPGVQCDIDAYCYLPLLEETGYMPKRKYAFGDEIFEHVKRIADQYDLYRQACFQTQATQIKWIEADGLWEVRTDRGDIMRAKYVCMANGPLNKPRLPGIPGISDFAGHMFHTSRWDYDYTGGDASGAELDRLHDKRVAIIGTGATALQCIPHLGCAAQHLYVVQRTPSSVDERNNSETDPNWAASLKPGWQSERIENLSKNMYGHPVSENLVDDKWTDMMARMRHKVSEKAAQGELSVEKIYELTEVADYESMENIRQRVENTVEDPGTAEKLKAYYRKLCKRPAFHDEYLPTFNRPNVTLVDTQGQGLTRITQNAIIFDDQEYEVDCIIFATGFEVGTDYTRRSGYEVYGKGGIALKDDWSDGPKTLYGIHGNGFPNLFYMGPINGSTGNNLTQTLNQQACHISHTIKRAEAVGAHVVEVSQQAQEDWRDCVAASGVEARDEFLKVCTPGYYNGEGDEKNKRGFWHHEYAGSVCDFNDILRDWRSVSHLPGVLVDGELLEPSAADIAHLKSKASIQTRLHRDARMMVDQLALMTVPQVGTLPVEMLRQMSAAGAAMRSSGPPILSQVDDKISLDGRDIPVRIYKNSETPDAIVIYYHGGGWCIGSLPEYDAPLRRIATMCNAAVVSVDYRLAPEHPFPACIDDAVEALKWVDDQRSTLAKPNAPLIVSGDSAGGNISAVMTQMARDDLSIQIDGQILIYPSVDLDIEHSRLDAFESPLLNKNEIKWFVEQYVPRLEDRNDVRFRPLLAKSHGKLPPALIFAAEYDLLKPEAEAYRDALEAASISVEYHQADGGVHGYFSAMDGQTHAQQAHKEIQAFVHNLAKT